MKAAFALSRSVKDGTQTQETNPHWQSVIHHFHHFSCENKGKGIAFSPLWWTCSFSLLISSQLVGDWWFCGVYGSIFQIKICLCHLQDNNKPYTVVNMHYKAGRSCYMLLLWILFANYKGEHANLSGPVNNSQTPAKICSIENILSH